MNTEALERGRVANDDDFIAAHGRGGALTQGLNAHFAAACK
jgi:hypothetical protein